MVFGDNTRFIIIVQEQKKGKYLFPLTADRDENIVLVEYYDATSS